MHDFLLSKEIIQELLKIIEERKLEKARRVSLAIGVIKMAHDGHPEHTEEINLDNLRFGLESISRGTKLEGAKFDIGRKEGDSWEIIDIETT